MLGLCLSSGPGTAVGSPGPTENLASRFQISQVPCQATRVPQDEAPSPGAAGKGP